MVQTNRALQTESTAAPQQWAPRFALGWAMLVFAVAVLALGYPALAGGFLVNPHSDQFIAGFAFREFAADHLRATGEFPLWNPYLYGGMPYVAAMHGDIFYPTFLLRMVLPTDVAMTWSFILHVFLAGVFTYVFLRACGLGFFASVAGGVAYAIGGNVAGLVSPGHDGKLYISALFPLTLLLALRGVRDGRQWAWGALAVVIGLAVLSPHPQLLQYLLLASGAFALYVAFSDFGGARLERRVAIRRLGLALGAIVIGGAMGAIQYLPVREYVPFSPRAAGKGWDHAVSYSLPPEELLNTIVPQFSGMLDKYWGRNLVHFHSEYIGAVVLVLAGLGIGAAVGRGGRKFAWFWLGVLVVSLLWAMGGYTPFYRLVYAIVPGTKFFRAPSTMLYVVSFSVAVLAALGFDRVLATGVSRRYLVGWATAGVVIAALGTSGGLTNLGASVALPQHVELVYDNAGELTAGSMRSFAFVLTAVGLLWATGSRRLTPVLGGSLVVGAIALDLWSVERAYWMFSPRASALYASNEAVEYIKRQAQPGRVIAVPLSNALGATESFLRDGGQGNGLMAHDIRSVLGYHGNQLARYDRLLVEEGGRQIVNPNFWALTNTRFWLTNVDSLPIPGTKRVVGPVRDAAGTELYLFEMPGANPIAWIVPAIMKVRDDDVLATVLDPRFDIRRIALFDTAAAVAGQTVNRLPEPLAIGVTATSYEPSRISLALDAPAPAGSALVVAENYYPGWAATVDGRPTVVGRADYALIGIELPAGGKNVVLAFDSAPYRTGKRVTAVALSVAGVWWLLGAFTERKRRV